MINMLLLKKTSDILFSLGAKVKALRLSCNWTRQELADRANVRYSTLARLEQTGQGSMSTYIQLLRILNAIEGLENLVDPPTPSPIEMMKFKGNVRQRGSGAGRKSRPPIQPEKKVLKSKPTSMTKAEQDQLIARFWANLRRPSAAENAFFAERAAAGLLIGLGEDGHLFCHEEDVGR
jgi:transcriptional regulator with XRE-family HTH domain